MQRLFFLLLLVTTIGLGTSGRADERGPADLVLAANAEWAVTANQLSNSLSLIDLKSGSVRHELPLDGRPAFLARCLDQNHVAVTCTDSGAVHVVQVKDHQLQVRSTISVGEQPVGLAVTSDGQRAFTGLTASGAVVEIDLRSGSTGERCVVGQWPRYLALSPDDSRLAVGCSGDSKIVVVDTESWEPAYEERLIGGINLGHMECSADGEFVYFPWMVYRSNPITVRNIRLGWVLASRIGRVRLDGPAYREAISLDVPRRAVSDPHGLAISADERRLVVSASGTHELLVYRQPDLPFIGVGGPGDLIDERLLEDDDLFYRIEVGGRPMGIEFAPDGRHVYVANYLLDSLQVIDIEERALVRDIPLGQPASDSLVRHGRALFYDGQRSLDQWYSCHSCHYDGGVNAKAMDTMNDGSQLTMKTVLPLQGVHETAPWTWHGWQGHLPDAIQKSFTTTMLGKPISAEDADAVLAFLETLELPPNPFRGPEQQLTAAAKRGQQIFIGSKAGCTQCHSGPYYTDGLIHDVGLGSEGGPYQGFNTPSLRGLYRKVRFLHDGRAKSLEAVLQGDHAPEKVAGEALNEQELADLIAFLKSL